MERNDSKILLIEDNLYEVSLIKHILAGNNITDALIHFENGEEALDFILGKGKFEGAGFASQVKLIILDLHLYPVNGFEIMQVLKEDPQASTIPVVVITGSRNPKDKRTSYDLGANSYVLKPWKYDDLELIMVQIVSYWLNHNQQRPAPPDLRSEKERE